MEVPQVKFADSKFPKSFIWTVVAICALPFLLNLLGVDFGSQATPFPWSDSAEMASSEKVDAMFYRLSGAFSHTLLEWSAFCTAIFTVILAFIHFRIKQDIVTPIIGIALFWAGCMDAFHTLAADRLIEATADNRNLIPFTWAICRMFNAVILLVGVGILLQQGKKQERHASFKLVSIVSVVFGFVAYGIIQYCATSRQLPETMFPDAFFTRPWDVVPLVFFIFAGTVIYPKFHKRYKSHFSQALWISAIPEVVCEIHMAFGSTALFDNHFNIAHFLKVIAYLVPFGGLVLSYIQTYNQEKQALHQLAKSQNELAQKSVDLAKINTSLRKEISERKRADAELREHAEKLARSNEELEQFAYVASHDLQEPLRKVTSFSELLAKKYSNQLDSKADEYIHYVVDGAARMQTLIRDLLAFSRVGQVEIKIEPTKLESAVNEALSILDISIQESKAEISFDSLPEVKGNPNQITQLFQNLIANSIKYRSEANPCIKISAEQQNSHWQISVSDNGIGIGPEYSERIFVIFQRLHTREEYTGTGVGLAICKKIVERHGGRIWVESEPGKGSTFYFTLHKKLENRKVDDKAPEIQVIDDDLSAVELTAKL